MRLITGPRSVPHISPPAYGARRAALARFVAARRDLLAAAVLIIGVSVFHLRGILPGQTLLPVDLANNNAPWVTEPKWLQNWLISDPLYSYYPYLVNSVRSVKDSGAWPLWNPRILMGHPTIADPLAQPFYPVFLFLGILFGAARGFAIGLWLHAVLAAFFTYGLLRVRGCGRCPAIAGGFTYALSGYLVTWFESTNLTGTLTWLPCILLAFELAVRRRRPAYVALAAAATGLAILAGQFTFVVSFALFFGLYAMGRAWQLRREGLGGAGWAVFTFVVALATGALLAGIQLLPFAEYFGYTRRVLSEGASDPLSWRSLVTLVVPGLLGTPVAPSPGFWGEMNYSEGTIYAGIVALLIACVAPLSSRRFSVWSLFLLGAAAVYFVAGGPGISLLGQLPIVKYASLHRSAFLLPLIVALLAGESLSLSRLRPGAVLGAALALAAFVFAAWTANWYGVRDHGLASRLPLIQSGALLAAGVALLIARDRLAGFRPLADWSLVGLVFLDLFFWGARFNPAGPVSDLLPLTPGLQYLSAHAGIDRAMTLQLGETLVGPNVLSVFDVAEPGGYSSVVSSRLHRLIAAGDPKIDIPWMSRESNMLTFSHPSSRLLDLLQVTYLVSREPFPDPGIRAETVATECDGSGIDIAAGRPAGGVFTVRDTAINRLDARVRVAKAGGETVFLRLWRGGPEGTPVAETSVTVESEPGLKNLTFYFAPEKDAPGQTYAWQLSAGPGSPSPSGLALCTSSQGQPAVSVYGAEGFQAFAGDVFIFKRLSPLPRAYVVYAAEQIADDAQATARLLDPAFDIRNVAVLAAATELPAAARPAEPAAITSYADTKVTLSARAAQPGLLVLGDQYHPGWQAEVDGSPAPILRVNQVMRGILLAPGDHTIVMRFAPASLRNGALVSLAGLAVLIALCAAGRLPSRRAN